MHNLFKTIDLSVRHKNVAVDPFDGGKMEAGCDENAVIGAQSLWAENVRSALAYEQRVVLQGGFATQKPEQRKAQEGAYSTVTLKAETPALVFWVEAMGMKQGDGSYVSLTGPDGKIIAESPLTWPKDKATIFQFVGAKRPKEGWAPGEYTGKFAVYPSGLQQAAAEYETKVVFKK